MKKMNQSNMRERERERGWQWWEGCFSWSGHEWAHSGTNLIEFL